MQGPSQRSGGKSTGGLYPAVHRRLMLIRAIFGKPFGIEPGTMHALHAEMVLGLEARRVVERAERQVHVLAVRIFERQRRAASRAIASPGDRRGMEIIGLALPAH